MAASLKERLGLGVAGEADDSEPETLRPLTPVEREWKQRIYDRLLKVLDLSLLGSLVDATFDDISGRARLTASIGGTLAAPRYEAAIELDNAVARPLGKDTDLEAPSGLIKLANGSLGFTDVKLRVRDQHRDEAGELHVKGNIALDGFRPVRWGVLISGKIAGKMLSVVAPRGVGQTQTVRRPERRTVQPFERHRPEHLVGELIDPDVLLITLSDAHGKALAIRRQTGAPELPWSRREWRRRTRPIHPHQPPSGPGRRGHERQRAGR